MSAAAAAVATANPTERWTMGWIEDRSASSVARAMDPTRRRRSPARTAIGERVVSLGARGCADPAMEAVTLAQVAALILLWPVTADEASYPAEKTRLLT